MSHLFGTERTYRAKLATSAFAAARRDHTRRPAQGDGDESDDALLRMPFKDARAAAIDGFEERGRGSCDRCPRGARLSTRCVVCARAGGAPGHLAALDRFSRRRLPSCPSVAQGKVKMLGTLRSIAKCSGSNLPPICEDRSTLPIGEPIVRQQQRRCFIPAFSFPGFDSIPGVTLAKHQPKFPTALRELLAKPLLRQDR